MFPFSVRSVGVYSFAQHLCEKYPFNGISFTISGLVHGRKGGAACPLGIPFFSFAVKGVSYEVEFDASRENWVAILEGVSWRPNETQTGVLLENDGETICLPLMIPVPRARVGVWQAEWQRLLEAWQSPLPRNRLRVQLGVMNILRYILDETAKAGNPTPAQKLREEIDKDQNFRETLTGLSRTCGRSVDHLRECFLAEYGILPQQYRQQRRMALAMDLISHSVLSVKEMSVQLGFEHVSAFSAMFRKHANMTVSEAVQQYRYGKAGTA